MFETYRSFESRGNCLMIRHAEFQTIEDLRKKQRTGQPMTFFEKRRIQLEDRANRKKKMAKR